MWTVTHDELAEMHAVANLSAQMQAQEETEEEAAAMAGR